jgi:hypothetical protein
LPPAVLWTFVGAAIPMIGYLFANAVYAQRVAKAVRRDPDATPTYDPSGLYARVGIATGVVYLAAGIAFRLYCIWLT